MVQELEGEMGEVDAGRRERSGTEERGSNRERAQYSIKSRAIDPLSSPLLSSSP